MSLGSRSTIVISSSVDNVLRRNGGLSSQLFRVGSKTISSKSRASGRRAMQDAVCRAMYGGVRE